jgi:predicted DNA-binding transcriptional regulator AlpA
MERMLTKAEVRERVPLSDQTIARMEAAGQFPARRSLGRGGRVGYLESEVDAWLRARPAGPLTNRTAAAREAAATPEARAKAKETREARRAA